MSNAELIAEVIAEVIEYHADTIGTHYEGCYKHHAVCLAVRLRDMLREPGAPDAATEELARIKPLFENYSREYPNECNKRVKAEAERDAATAAVERVRARLGDILPDWSDSGVIAVADILAALDGAPEPAGLPVEGESKP